MKVYAKNSFDRFGDDLTELILQYLTFEDKVRLECVSKQWRRYVYIKQFVIGMLRDEKLIKSFRNIRKRTKAVPREALELLLKKSPNISRVCLAFKVSNEVLSLIGRYCPRLKSLDYSSDDDKALDFFRMYGHKLEELSLREENPNNKSFLKFCPNLKKIFVQELPVLLTEDKDFLPKLERIESFIEISPEDVNQLKILSDKYSQTMKILNVSFCQIILTSHELKTCFDCISRFENLKELKLSFDGMKTEEPIDDCLSLIGQKCTKLLKMKISINKSLLISDRFFDVFTHFKGIKKLKIELKHRKELNGSIECFKHCKQLNELDINYPELTEDFFANIASFVPKLQFLKILTEKEFSDSFIDSFHSMKSIQKVKLFFDNVENLSFYTKFWYFGKSLSEVMSSSDGMDVIRVNDNCGLISNDDEENEY